MKKMKFSMQGLIERNKKEIMDNKFEIERIEKMIDEKHSMKKETKQIVKN